MALAPVLASVCGHPCTLRASHWASLRCGRFCRPTLINLFEDVLGILNCVCDGALPRRAWRTVVEKKKDRENINAASQPRTDRFDEAVERVYRRYGNDLSAFTRDVQRDMAKNAQILRSGRRYGPSGIGPIFRVRNEQLLSPGGNISITRGLLRLLRLSDQNSSEACRLITVATTKAQSSAADLLSSGDYAIAVPGCSLLYHGVRTPALVPALQPLTAERTSVLAHLLRLTNDVFAMELVKRALCGAARSRHSTNRTIERTEGRSRRSTRGSTAF